MMTNFTALEDIPERMWYVKINEDLRTLKFGDLKCQAKCEK